MELNFKSCVMELKIVFHYSWYFKPLTMENYTAQKSKSLKKQIESEINKAAREKELKKAGYVRQN